MTLNKDAIILGVIKVEGGYVNDPNDLGGETNWGITAATANSVSKRLCDEFCWSGKMVDLTKEMACAVYDELYWKPLQLDTISKHSVELADKLFDIGVNIGVKRAGMWLQQLLNVLNRQGKDYPDIKADGIIGKGTLSALNSFIRVRGQATATSTLVKGLFCMQGAHYIAISEARPQNENFMFGWLQRMNHNVDLYAKNWV